MEVDLHSALHHGVYELALALGHLDNLLNQACSDLGLQLVDPTVV